MQKIAMMTKELKSESISHSRTDPSDVLAKVADALHGLKFGQITITVHDGDVVQIERIERTRLQQRRGD